MTKLLWRGRFPYRSKDTGKSVTDLVLEDIAKLDKWFKEKDIRIMMWGDMFLWKDEAESAAFAPSLEEAKKRREGIPEGSIITDWHYDPAPPEKYPSLKIFKDLGLDTIACGWYNPKNIKNLCLAADMFGITGYLQTTWAGFNFAIDGNEEAWFQYWVYILAGHYSWSCDETEAEELPFSAAQMFVDLWSERKPITENKYGYIFDISQLYNLRLEDDGKAGGWMGYGSEIDFSSFPANEIFFGGTQFRVRKNSKGNSAVLLAGTLNPKGDYPEEIRLNTETC